MKACSLLLFLCAALGWTQSAPPAPSNKPDTVIAIFEDGTKLTLGEFQALVPVLPETYRQLAEQNPQRFLKVFAMYKKAAAAAESLKLGEKAPYKLGVEFAVTVAMAQADFLESTAAITVSPRNSRSFTTNTKSPSDRSK